MQQSEQIQHIGIIMDGNRRWAKKLGKHAVFGHRAGVKSLKLIRELALEKGIKYVTVWAFSTENWKRDKKEVAGMIGLLRSYLSDEKELKILEEQEIKLRVIGDTQKFSEDIQDLIRKAIDRSKQGTKAVFTIALSYGGRNELQRVIQKIIQVGIKAEEITEKMVEKFLDTAGIPDPELIIRTGGNRRLSGFLPWQCVYSELYFTDTFWPDFGPKELQKALDWFAEQKRNFGK